MHSSVTTVWKKRAMIFESNLKCKSESKAEAMRKEIVFPVSKITR